MPQSINPATERKIADYPEMPSKMVEGIIKDTSEASRIWANVPVDQRAALLKQAACVLERRKDKLALLITREMGKPIKEASAEIEKCAWVCHYYAENGPGFLGDESVPSGERNSYIAYRPLGVVLAIMPWNFPFWQVFRFAAPGLTAGNGALLKHASNVTGCGLAIEEIFREAGYPENIFRTLIVDSGKIGEIIASDLVQAATLTGSEPAGRAVAQAAGKAIKKVVLELGGSDPYLILEDADIDKAADLCSQSRLLNGGQSCIAAKRFIVHESVRKEFTDKLEQAMSRKVIGNPEDPATDIGPMARKDLRDEVHQQVQASIKAGAPLVMGGQKPAGTGFFYAPTILSGVEPGMPAYEEEVFGPVAAIISARDTEDAVRIANDSPFGLGSAIFSRNTEEACRIAARIQTGCCFINDFVKSDPRLPFGGIKRSGFGRELSYLGIREFVNIQTVVVG